MTTLRQTIKDLPIGPEHAVTIPTSKIATVRSTASQLRLKISLKITVTGETATVEKVGQDRFLVLRKPDGDDHE